MKKNKRLNKKIKKYIKALEKKLYITKTANEVLRIALRAALNIRRKYVSN